MIELNYSIEWHNMERGLLCVIKNEGVWPGTREKYQVIDTERQDLSLGHSLNIMSTVKKSYPDEIFLKAWLVENFDRIHISA